MIVAAPHRPLQVLTISSLLLRGRASAGRAVIDLLAITTFTLSTGLLLSVLAGARAFFLREQVPPAGFLAALGDQAATGVGQLSLWTLLAGGATVMLVLPLLTLSSAAARMGALGRDQRLSALRLLGVSAVGTVALAATEMMAAAAIGALAGCLLYLGLVPVLSLLTFQATPLAVGELLLPWTWVLATAGFVVVLAGSAAVLGLREVRISPLGVARRTRRRGIRWHRLLALPIAVIGWVGLAPLLDFNAARTAAIAATMVMLAGFMGVANLIGPLVLQVTGRMMLTRDSPSSLLAGRRLLADPKGAWRNVAGLAFAGFTGGALLALPELGSSPDPLGNILAADLRTGTLLTLSIAFVVAAASAALNQAAAVLDRRTILVRLSHAGVPRDLIDSSRRHEVLVPTLVASVGSAALSAVFFCTLGATSGLLPNPGGIAWLAGVLLAGTAVVLASSESCRPLAAGILAGAGARAQ